MVLGLARGNREGVGAERGILLGWVLVGFKWSHIIRALGMSPRDFFMEKVAYELV